MGSPSPSGGTEDTTTTETPGDQTAVGVAAGSEAVSGDSEGRSGPGGEGDQDTGAVTEQSKDTTPPGDGNHTNQDT